MKNPRCLSFKRIEKERPLARLIVFEDGRFVKRKEWIPKSQSEILGDDLMMPMWLVVEKQLEDFVTFDGE